MTTPQTPAMSPEEAVKRIEAGRKQLAALTNRASALGGQVAAARTQLAELEAEAKQAYETSDLNELRATFLRWQAENDQAVTAFEEALRVADTSLTEVEQAVRVATSGTA